MSKKITSFNLDRSITRISRSSVFTRILKEIDAIEIPVQFVEQVLVQYMDGSIVELDNDILDYPVSVNNTISWDKMADSSKTIKDVKISVNIEVLEKHINELVEKYLGKLC